MINKKVLKESILKVYLEYLETGIKRHKLTFFNIYIILTICFFFFLGMRNKEHVCPAAGEGNSALLEFLQSRNPKGQHSFSLESYLIKPIQRILKYPLLLQQLKHLTDPISQEHLHLSGDFHSLIYLNYNSGEIFYNWSIFCMVASIVKILLGINVCIKDKAVFLVINPEGLIVESILIFVVLIESCSFADVTVLAPII